MIPLQDHQSQDKPDPAPPQLSRFSLRHDQADAAAIDAALRTGAELRGATPWILMLAILIASIGLNVNSPAVIIGAMLISPLMGPIIGIGYGVGIYDFPLIRRSLLNLAIATALSLGTSTLYFLLTPLSEAQSELLARTSPTIWDVLIALFGGLAGIIAATRRLHSNVIPGVAIATALMPPLCTAGYALAERNWSSFGGAFYLFSINCVFIAVATVIVTSLLHLPHRRFVDPAIGARVKRWLLLIVMLTTAPSLYLAFQMVNEALFKNAARQFVRQQFQDKRTHVTELKITPATRKIELSLIGEPISAIELRAMEQSMAGAGLQAATLAVHQAGDNRIDVNSLKAGILGEIYRDSQVSLRASEQQLAQLQQDQAHQRGWVQQSEDIARELKAQFPSAQDVFVGEGIALDGADQPPTRSVAVLSARFEHRLSLSERQRIENWFMARSKAKQVRLILQAPGPIRASASRRAAS